jgi:hypothetical protein
MSEFKLRVYLVPEFTDIPDPPVPGTLYFVTELAKIFLCRSDLTLEEYAGGGLPGLPGADGREVEIQSDGTAIQWRYAGDADWTDIESLENLKGPKGDTGDGLHIAGNAAAADDLPASAPVTDVWLAGGHLYSYDGSEWIDHGEIQGPAGEDGPPGADGRELELRKNGTTVQWRLAGDTDWTNLFTLEELALPPEIDGGNAAGQ